MRKSVSESGFRSRSLHLLRIHVLLAHRSPPAPLLLHLARRRGGQGAQEGAISRNVGTANSLVIGGRHCVDISIGRRVRLQIRQGRGDLRSRRHKYCAGAAWLVRRRTQERRGEMPRWFESDCPSRGNRCGLIYESCSSS
eukprot:scaffold1014_cov260-Pinguiococcus_pyrenoidosus.AAC.5